MSEKHVDSAGDQRADNNLMRHKYRLLNDQEKAALYKIKDDGLALHRYVDSLGNSRELAIAREKIEEAVMWAVKHITG